MSRYKALEPIFRTKHCQPLSANRPTRVRYLDRVVSLAPDDVLDILETYSGEYYAKMGDRASVGLSISKMDKSPVRLYKGTESWRVAKEVVDSLVYSRFRGLGVTSFEKIMSTLTMKASAGVVFAQWGCKTKLDAFQHPQCAEYILSDPTTHDTPIWKVVPKVEWGLAEDIDNGKVRTFIVPPVDLVFWTKFCYDSQNEALKNFWWSAYGFNPYGGGTDELVRALQVWTHFFYYDVTGWDRLLPTMRMVHRRRINSCPFPYRSFAQWCSVHCCNSFLLLPDGTIVFKDWGNNSGSAVTTTDNILSHLYVEFCALYEYYGSIEVALSCVSRVYGDDNVMSLPYLMPGGVEKLKSTFVEVYGWFGLVLDPLVYTENIEEIEFLGFSPKRTDFGYVPLYKTGRVVSAFKYVIEKHNLEASFAKAWSLTIMAAPGPEEAFDAMCRVLEVACYKFRNSDSPVVKSYINFGIPQRDECLRFMLGLETNRWLDGIFNYDLIQDEYCC